jgi:hypothetical protein
MSQKRKMPSRKAIASFWNDELGYNNGNNCFACHWGGALERCHITARHNGGSDGVENLHVLCQACHDDSEAIEGKQYLNWLGHVREKVSRNWFAYHYPKHEYHIKNPPAQLISWIKKNRKDFYAQYKEYFEKDQL